MRKECESHGSERRTPAGEHQGSESEEHVSQDLLCSNASEGRASPSASRVSRLAKQGNKGRSASRAPRVLSCNLQPAGMPLDPEEYLSHANPEFQHLICVICEGVFEDPVQCCSEHYFCRSCITDWLSRSATCPIDRSCLTAADLRPAPRLLTDVIASLLIRCRYHVFGCLHGMAGQRSLLQHLLSCDQREAPLLDHDYLDGDSLDARERGQSDRKPREGGGGDASSDQATDGKGRRGKEDPLARLLVLREDGERMEETGSSSA